MFFSFTEGEYSNIGSDRRVKSSLLRAKKHLTKAPNKIKGIQGGVLDSALLLLLIHFTHPQQYILLTLLEYLDSGLLYTMNLRSGESSHLTGQSICG